MAFPSTTTAILDVRSAKRKNITGNARSILAFLFTFEISSACRVI